MICVHHIQYKLRITCKAIASFASTSLNLKNCYDLLLVVNCPWYTGTTAQYWVLSGIEFLVLNSQS